MIQMIRVMFRNARWNIRRNIFDDCEVNLYNDSKIFATFTEHLNIHVYLSVSFFHYIRISSLFVSTRCKSTDFLYRRFLTFSTS